MMSVMSSSLKGPKAEDGLASTTSTLTGDQPPREKIDNETSSTNKESDADPNSNGAGGKEDYPSGLKLFFIVSALVLSVFLLSLDMTIVATAIPKITEEFKGLDKVGWYGAAFFMTNGAFQSTWGKIYKFFPLKHSFLTAILIFEIGSTICAAAPSAEAFIAGRAIAGLGAAGLGAGAYTIIAFSAPPAKRPAYTGIIGASYGFASVLGPLLGGVFTDGIGWRWCFYINLPIGGFSAAIILFFFKAPEVAQADVVSLGEKFRQMDLPGVAMIMGATVCYLLVVQMGGVSDAWNSAVVIGLIVGFVAIIGVWIGIQWYQGERSMVPPRLIKQRTNYIMSTYAFIFAAGFFATIYYIPIYFQSVHGTTPIMSGVRNLPMIVAVSISTITSGWLVSKVGYYQPILLGGGALATIGSGLLYLLDTNSSTGEWIGYQILIGVGFGLAFQIPMIAVQGHTDPKDMASTTGMLLFFQGIGGAYLVSGAQAAFVNTMTRHVLHLAPEVSKSTLVLTGATEIRHSFTPVQQPIVIDGYMAGLKVVFAMCIACTGIATVVGFGARWQKLGQDKRSGGGIA